MAYARKRERDKKADRHNRKFHSRPLNKASVSSLPAPGFVFVIRNRRRSTGYGTDRLLFRSVIMTGLSPSLPASAWRPSRFNYKHHAAAVQTELIRRDRGLRIRWCNQSSRSRRYGWDHLAITRMTRMIDRKITRHPSTVDEFLENSNCPLANRAVSNIRTDIVKFLQFLQLSIMPFVQLPSVVLRCYTFGLFIYFTRKNISRKIRFFLYFPKKIFPEED